MHHRQAFLSGGQRALHLFRVRLLLQPRLLALLLLSLLSMMAFGVNDSLADSVTDLLLRFVDKSFEINLYGTTEETGGRDSALLIITTKTSKAAQAAALDKPPRIVVDIPDLKARQSYTLAVKPNPLIKAVRVGVQPDRLRVVLDLSDQASPKALVRRSGNNIEVRVGAYSPVSSDTVLSPAENGRMTVIEGGERPPKIAQPTPPLAPITTPQATVQPSKEAFAPPSPAPSATPEPEAKVEAEETPTPTPTPAEPTETPAQAEGTATAAATPSADVSRSIILPPNLPPPEQLLKFSVDKVFVTFEAKQRPIQNITVRNKTTSPLFMTVKVERAINPGTPLEKAAPTQDLVASPRRFELKVDESRDIRIILNSQPSGMESVFRISLLPQSQSFDETLIEAQISGKPASLKLVAGMAITVDALPSNPVSKVAWKIQGDVVTLSNKGNASFLLESGRFCPQASERCSPVPSKRLYAGADWSLRLPARGTLEFLKRFGIEYEPLIISTEGREQ